MATITDIIKAETKRFIKEENGHCKNSKTKSAYDINSGLCEDFAESIAQKVKGVEVLETHNFSDINGIINYKGKRVILPFHSWIKYRGKHYDAETPEGVTEFMDLKIFKNARGKHK